MTNLDRLLNNLPLEHKPLPLCAMTKEMVQEQPNPLSLLLEFPYESQWLDKDAWNWLAYELMQQQGKQYAETGNIKSFTAQAAYNIAKA